MIRKLVLPVVLALLCSIAAPPTADASTCTGADPCRACRSCRSCKHCADGSGTCGICKLRK